MNQCPLCLSKNTNFAFNSQNYHGKNFLGKEKFKIYKCQNCLSLFLTNIKTSKQYYDKYYPKSYTISPNIIDKIYSFVNKINYSKYFPNYKKISFLDIGCGNSQLLDSLPSKYEKYGTDIKKQTKKHNIFIGDFNKINIPKKFDCINMSHFLEHTSNPQKILLKAKTLLKNKGKIFITVPNALSLGQKIGKKYYYHLDSPRHFFVPSPKAIKTILQQTKYKKIKIIKRYFDFPLDLFWSVRHSPLKYIIYPLYPIFKILSPETLLIIAQK